MNGVWSLKDQAHWFKPRASLRLNLSFCLTTFSVFTGKKKREKTSRLKIKIKTYSKDWHGTCHSRFFPPPSSSPTDAGQPGPFAAWRKDHELASQLFCGAPIRNNLQVIPEKKRTCICCGPRPKANVHTSLGKESGIRNRRLTEGASSSFWRSGKPDIGCSKGKMEEPSEGKRGSKVGNESRKA